MATIGWLSFKPPVDPRKGAVPSPKTPPSAATSQAPGAAMRPTPEVVPSAAALAPWPAGSAELAIEADIVSTLAAAVVAATRPTTRRRPRRGRPMVRIFVPIRGRIAEFLPVWAIGADGHRGGPAHFAGFPGWAPRQPGRTPFREGQLSPRPPAARHPQPRSLVIAEAGRPFG